MKTKVERKRFRRRRKAKQCDPTAAYEYRPGRKLRRFDYCRIGKGPVYVDDSGERHRFGVPPGKYVFLSHNVDAKGNEYLIVSGAEATSAVVMLTPRESTTGLRIEYRPYRIRKVRGTWSR